MALTRAQLLMGNDSQGAVLPGEVQGVKQGAGILIATDGTISVDSTSVIGLVKLNNAGAFNGYVWPSVSGTTGQVLTKGTGNTLLWTNGGVFVSPTAPLNPEIGDLWFDCTAGQLLVYEACTSGTPKWSGSGAGLPVLPGNSSASPAFASGSGTLLSPYVTSATTASSGSAVTVLNVVTVNGLAPFQLVPIVDLNAYVNGGRFSFTNNVANSSGVLTFEIVFTDSPVSPNGSTYTANIKVGNSSIYINAGISIVDSFFIVSPGRITGSPLIGSTLTYTPGTFNGGAPPVTTSWKWYENTTGTLLQTGGTTYLTTSNEFGDTIFVVFTATDVNGTFTSAPTAQFGPIDRPPFPGPTPPTIPINSNGTSSSTWASGSTTIQSSNCLQFNKNGGTFGQGPTSVINGDIITTRWNPSSLCANAPDGTLIDGCLFDTNFSSCGSLTIDRIPNAVTFAAATNVTPGAVVTSNTVTPTGYNTPCYISYNSSSTGSNWKASINGAPFVTVPLPGVDTVSMSPGSTLAVQFTTGSAATTTYNFVVDLGAAGAGISNTFAATTGTAGFPNLSPSLAAGPTTIPGTASGTWADGSTTLNSTGCLLISTDNIAFGTGPLAVTNSSTLYEKWSTSGICGGAANGTLISGTLTNGTTTQSYNFTIDRFPAPFTFTPNTNVNLGAVSTSNTVTLSGTNTSAYVTYGASSTGTSIEGSVDGGLNWSVIPATGGTSFIFNPGQTLKVRLTTGLTISTAYTAVITVGDASSGTSATFTATTAAVPDFPNLPPTLAAGPSTIPGTASGTWADGTTSLTSTSCIEFKVGAGSFNQGPTTVNNSDVVTVQYVTSPGCSGAASGTTITGTLTNGTNTNNYSLTLDRNPDTFTISSQTGQAQSSTATSGSVTLAGTNSPAYITYTAGNPNTLTNIQVSVNSGAYVPVPTSGTSVSAPPGASLQFQGDVGASATTVYTATINVGTTTASWSVTTSSGATPTISQPSISAPLNNATNLDPGLNTPAAITATGSTYTALNGAGVHVSSDWLYQDLGPASIPLITSAITSISAAVYSQTLATSRDTGLDPAFPARNAFLGTLYTDGLAVSGTLYCSSNGPGATLTWDASSYGFTSVTSINVSIANGLATATFSNGSTSTLNAGSNVLWTTGSLYSGTAKTLVSITVFNGGGPAILGGIQINGVVLRDNPVILNLANNTNLSSMTVGDTLAYYNGSLSSAASYQVSRSLLFNSNNYTYLNRSIGNITTFTLSLWYKPTQNGALNIIYATPSSTGFIFFLNPNGNLCVYLTNGTTVLISSGTYNTASKWYNAIVTADGTTLSLYVNGVLDSAVTSSIGLYSGPQYLGYSNFNASTNYANLYMTEVYLIDGSVKTPSNFGQTDSATNQWVPKAYSSTYGSAGFYVNFSDSSNATATTLGKDYSGNNNNFTPNNFSLANGGGDNFISGWPAGTLVPGASFSGLVSQSTVNVVGEWTVKDSGEGSVIWTGSKTGIQTLEFWMWSNLAVSDEDGNYSTIGFAINGTSVPKTGIPGAPPGPTGSWVNVTSTLQSTATPSTLTSIRIGRNRANQCDQIGAIRINGTTILTDNTLAATYTPANNTNLADGNTWVNIFKVNNPIGIYSSDNTTATATLGTTKAYTSTVELLCCSTNGSAPIYANGTAVTSPPTGNNINDARWRTVLTGSGTLTSVGVQSDGSQRGILFQVRVDGKQLINIPGFSSDIFVDSPTYYGTNTGVGYEVRGSYPTWNPANSVSSGNFSNGNLNYDAFVGAVTGSVTSTVAVNSGKWYCEIIPRSVNNATMLGLAPASVNYSNGTAFWQQLGCVSYYFNGGIGNGTATTLLSIAPMAANDVIGFALDLDAGTLTIYVNNVSQGVVASRLTGSYFMAAGIVSNLAVSYAANFGQSPFVYTAPAGYKPWVQQTIPPFGTITAIGTSSINLNPSYGTWVVSQRGENTATSIANSLTGLASTNTITAGGGTSTLTISAANTDGFIVGNPVTNGLTGGSSASGEILTINGTTVTLSNVTGSFANGQNLYRGYSTIVNATGDTVNLVSYPILQALLNTSKRYAGRVRYKSTTTTSPWSSYSAFSTASNFSIQPGTAMAGGYYGGQINVQGAIYNLIVAPADTGQYPGGGSGGTPTNVKYKTSNSADSPGATFQDKAYGKPANDTGNNASHPAFQWARALNIGGFTDWYIPAQNELAILYFFLKPDTTTNDTASGSNANSVSPYTPSTNYGPSFPSQTASTLFQTSGAQAFSTGNYYWSSTEDSSGTTTAFLQKFDNGNVTTGLKSFASFAYARAIRKVPA